jgi:MEMO1 family protein
MERIRPAAVAGSFYPGEAEHLKDLLAECFDAHPLGPRGYRASSASLLGGMVPHAGYAYSGPCAAHLYSRIDRATSLVIVLGVDHRARGARAALSPAESWRTPLGNVPIERKAGNRLRDEIDFLTEDERVHSDEHSIEVQLPFLQTILGAFHLLPVALSHISEGECRRLGAALARLYEAETAAGTKVVLLASSDLSHYLSPEETERLDRMALEEFVALDASGLLETVSDNNITMCGVVPAAVLLFAGQALKARGARLLKHCHSGDVAPMRQVVGYASVAVEV